MDCGYAAAVCLRSKTDRLAEMAHFHASVQWLSCYDESLRGLSFPGCCVPSLGHMSLFNKCSSERGNVWERGREKCIVSQWLRLLTLWIDDSFWCSGKHFFCFVFVCVITSHRYLHSSVSEYYQVQQDQRNVLQDNFCLCRSEDEKQELWFLWAQNLWLEDVLVIWYFDL